MCNVFRPAGGKVGDVVHNYQSNSLANGADKVWQFAGWPTEVVALVKAAPSDGQNSRGRGKHVWLNVLAQFIKFEADVFCRNCGRVGNRECERTRARFDLVRDPCNVLLGDEVVTTTCISKPVLDTWWASRLAVPLLWWTLFAVWSVKGLRQLLLRCRRL